MNLRLMEREDLALGVEWVNNPGYFGDYQPLSQQSKTELEEQYDKLTLEERWFFIEKKGGTKIGTISYGPIGKAIEIGFNIVPSERGKNYGRGCWDCGRFFVSFERSSSYPSLHRHEKCSFSESPRKKWVQEGRNSSEIYVHERRLERFVSVQHTQARMERTKDADKDDLRN